MNTWSILRIEKILPDGILKGILRKIFYRYIHNEFYGLNRMIKNVDLLQEGILVELSNGSKFYGSREKEGIVYYPYKYGDPRKLDKLKDFEHFVDFYSILSEQFVRNDYEAYHKLRKGDIVVDAGANVGVFSVKAARTVGPEGKVIAIEPEKNNLRYLEKNIEANGLQNIIIVPEGIWSKKGKERLYLASSGYHSLVFENRVEFRQIEVNTLDNMLEKLNIGRVDFVKMDVEGAEFEGLKGAQKTLRDNDVRLAIDACHEVNGKKTYENIVLELTEMGFKAWVDNEIVYAEKYT